jgi:hypothetical protein
MLVHTDNVNFQPPTDCFLSCRCLCLREFLDSRALLNAMIDMVFAFQLRTTSEVLRYEILYGSQSRP